MKEEVTRLDVLKLQLQAVQERVNRHAAEGQLVQLLYNQALAEAQALEQAIKDEEAKKA
jgi:flagellin-specific chaperone FliS